MALRLHRTGYQSDAAIGEELAICEALADADFACPRPYRTAGGDFVLRLSDGQTRASVVQWIDAPPLESVPEKALPCGDRYHMIGALLAAFHRSTDAHLRPPRHRPGWDRKALTGADGLWGDCLDDPHLHEAERVVLERARHMAWDRLGTLDPAACGWIHGDALPGNILWRAGSGSLIDFDDCGWGYRLYDLATALIGVWNAPEAPTATAALRDGYLRAHGPLAASAFGDLALFVMLRAQASAAWARSRCGAQDPRIAQYRQRAVTLSRELLTIG